MEKRKKSLTKEKIKSNAIKLFNEKETLSITTNHIAKEAKISTGNLYYHYKNKEEIIRDIYLDMSQEFEEYNSFEKIFESENPLKALSNAFDFFGELFWKYKFMMRDCAVLLAIDPILKEIFSKKQEIRINQIEALLRIFIKEGILENIKEEDIKLRAKLNWFISSYWQGFVSTQEEITKESIKEAKEVVFRLHIYPFLTKKGEELSSL